MSTVSEDDNADRALADTEDAELQRPVEKAYRGIRQAILRGELKPGDHLGEEQLAAMTGTSRTPVREALQRLAAEGLATVSNRHRFVTHFTHEEVSIMFDIRAQLEGYSASLAAQKITAPELATLQNLIDAMAEIENDTSSEVAERFLALNSQFHAVIIEATRSTQLKRLTAPATSLPLVLLKQFVMEQKINVPRSNRQHRDIYAALAAHNSEWAAAAMSGHILSTKPKPRDPVRGLKR